jgi:hypothetical protein
LLGRGGGHAATSYLTTRYGAKGTARCDTDESDEEGSLLDLPAVSTTDDILMSRLAVSMDRRVWYAHYGGISEPQAPSVGHRDCFYTYAYPSYGPGQSYIIHASQG